MKNIKILIAVVILFLVSSCTTQQGWTYKKNDFNAVSKSKFSNSSVVIPEFEDARLNDNKNNILLYLIPFYPFGSQKFSTPETVAGHLNSGLWVNFKPTEDFAKALILELESTNIFYEVYFSNRKSNERYSIKGRIVSTKYEGKMLSYGLSFYAGFLWFAGLPATSVSNDLALELSFIDNKNNNIIFSKSYRVESKKEVSWIYNIKSDFKYSYLLKDIYKQFIDDLSNHI